MNTGSTLILLVILAIVSLSFTVGSQDGFGMSYNTVAQDIPINNIVDGFGMSPGTLDQLASTSVNTRKGMYILL